LIGQPLNEMRPLIASSKADRAKFGLQFWRLQQGFACDEMVFGDEFAQQQHALASLSGPRADMSHAMEGADRHSWSSV
jgi:hypothetical protein